MVIYEAALVVQQHFHELRAVALKKSEVTTTTNEPFSPLFETAFRLTNPGWYLSFMGPNQGGRRSFAGHSSVTQDH